MKLNCCFFLVGLLFSITSISEVKGNITLEDLLIYNNSYQNYIDTYSKIAILEMERTGVPASIKLAQGLLESGAGTTELARNAKNHFGMKCGNYWKGKEYFRKDDDYKNGRLIKSCFRVYSDATESYIAHSDFLRDPKKGYRYGFLFLLDRFNYKDWAHGLKKSGYATDSKYPKKLIKLIEQYELYKYDKMGSDVFVKPPEVLVENTQDKVEVVRNTVFYTINQLKTVYAFKNENIDNISKRTGVSTKRILKYNEIYKSSRQTLEEGDQVFLQPKRNKYRGAEKYHYVQPGETMEDISQKYGVKLKRLLKCNKKTRNSRLKNGERIKLKGFSLFGWNKKNSFLDLFKKKKDVELVDLTDEDEHWMDESIFNLEGGEIVMSDEYEQELEENKVSTEVESTLDFYDNSKQYGLADNTEIGNPDEFSAKGIAKIPELYEVKRGDSLFKIAKKFNLKIGRIKALNSLKTNAVQVGQKLRLKKK